MTMSKSELHVLVFATAATVALVSAQCGPDASMPYPPGTSECPSGPPVGGNTGGDGGNTGNAGGAGAPTATSSHAASMLGDVGMTTVSGVDERTGTQFSPGENIYGPFEAGFTDTQNNILESLGCSDGSLGHVAGGIDTHTAEQMVAHQCSIDLPRIEGDLYISLLDECGGHTNEYHFHQRMTCLYKNEGGHSTKVGQALDGKPLYGKWEDYENQILPKLDACGGHYGVTPESPDTPVYHYHIQDTAPFSIGCFGPNDDGSLVTVQQCRDFYPGCDGELTTVTAPEGSMEYDLWCPCFDANGSNTGVNIAELAVFSEGTAVTGLELEEEEEETDGSGAQDSPSTDQSEKRHNDDRDIDEVHHSVLKDLDSVKDQDEDEHKSHHDGKNHDDDGHHHEDHHESDSTSSTSKRNKIIIISSSCVALLVLLVVVVVTRRLCTNRRARVVESNSSKRVVLNKVDLPQNAKKQQPEGAAELNNYTSVHRKKIDPAPLVWNDQKNPPHYDHIV